MEVMSSEDAQLQARLWNRFVKRRTLEPNEGVLISPDISIEADSRAQSSLLLEIEQPLQANASKELLDD